VPYAAGGVSDIVARTIGQKLSDGIGQPLVIENRGGAGGTIGADVVATAAPDGYTLMFSSIGIFAIAPHMMKKMTFNPATAFTAIGGVALSPSIITVGASQPMKTLKDVVAAAKANPGKIVYGSSGIGSIGHLTGELLSAAAGIEMTHVPFKSGVLAFPDAITGAITMVIDSVPSALQHLRSGAMRPVAMLSPTRIASLPDVPTMTEAGYPDATLVNWSGLHGPANLAPAALQRMSDALTRAISAPDTRERFASLGADPWLASGKELEARARQDSERLGKAIRAAGIQPE
jgi:tripartite-type tricarboxylate transporter receptor subunit TctC